LPLRISFSKSQGKAAVTAALQTKNGPRYRRQDRPDRPLLSGPNPNCPLAKVAARYNGRICAPAVLLVRSLKTRAAMRAQLVPLDNGSPIDLVKDLTVVGRTDGCDLRLEHKSVSKLHCVIVKTDGLLLLRDLGSTNGTRVNGQRVRRAALLPNDQLTIATYKFRVLFGPDNLPPQADECTQQIAPGELAELVHKAKGGDEDSGGDLPAVPPVRTNLLPDVYPEA
jgi:hypothetical protein